MLATTKSPRVASELELINWDSGKDYGVPPYARASCTVQTSAAEHDLTIILESQPNATTSRKKCVVDGKSVRASTMVGLLKVVEFSPEDVQLVTGPPSDRRKQLDILISQIDRSYMVSASRYAKVLSQRNGLLRQFLKDGVTARSRDAVEQLGFWDDELVLHGSHLVALRARVIRELAAELGGWSAQLVRDAQLGITYSPGIPNLVVPDDQTDEAHIRAWFHRQLEHARSSEFRRGTTTIGPQRDDFMMTINDRLLAAYGSRGQQRLGVIALKLSEGKVIERLTNETPVVLFDDVFSELDEMHSGMLIESMQLGQHQMFVTSANPNALSHPGLSGLPVIETDAGI